MGVTDNGDHLFWVTPPGGTPDEWTVAITEGLRPPWFTYDGSLTEFLVGVLDGTTRVPLFPRDLLENGPVFTPSAFESSTPAVIAARTSFRAREVRDWANAHGYGLPERGRIPIDVIEAWKQEHPG
ncbi:histone-like nucleoid-structuring protein Lsr2 [Streptomyces sp. NPDC056144]|uniref:Lsr2 family DNA-binding protein n=1 Tax=unclassified Streptomyces TaxID=2593676 RepID=UPI0035D98F05